MKILIFSVLYILCLSINYSFVNQNRVNEPNLTLVINNPAQLPRITELLKEIPKTFFNYEEWQYEIENEKINLSNDYIWIKKESPCDSSYLNASILDNSTLALSIFCSDNIEQYGCMDCNHIASKIIILKKEGTKWESINKQVFPDEFYGFISKVFENPVNEKDGYTVFANEFFNSHAPFAHFRDKKLIVRDISVLNNGYGNVIELDWLNGKFEIKQRKKLPLKPKLDKITNEEFRNFLSGFRYIPLPESFCVSKYYLNKSLEAIPEKYYSLIDIDKLDEYTGTYFPIQISDVSLMEYVGIIKISETFVALIFRTAEANNYPNRKNLILATFRPNGEFINSIILCKGGDDIIESTIEKTLTIRHEITAGGEGSTDFVHRIYKIEKDGHIKMISNKKERQNW